MFDDRGCNEISVVSKKELSFLYKRNGRWQEAAQIWQELVTSMPADYSTISELAKWLEHRVRDYRRAQVMIEKALDQEDAFSAEERESLSHRLKRLKIKIKDGR
jgi:predicted patatin/cPLA2 family phospholipase